MKPLERTNDVIVIGAGQAGLFSPTRSNHLPGMAFPGDPWSFPTKDEVADYLEDRFGARREGIAASDLDASDGLSWTV